VYGTRYLFHGRALNVYYFITLFGQWGPNGMTHNVIGHVTTFFSIENALALKVGL